MQLCLLLTVLLSAIAVYSFTQDEYVDYDTYYVAGLIMARGSSPYTATAQDFERTAEELGLPDIAHPYRYPPLTVSILSQIPVEQRQEGAMVWMGLSVALLVICAWLCGTYLGKGWYQASFLAFACNVPAWTVVYAGQINAFLLIGIVLALVASKHNKELACGFALGFGTMVKVIPLSLVGLMIWRTRWRVVLGVAISIAAIIGVSVWLGGAGYFLDALLQASQLASGTLVEPYVPNQTINGALGRLYPSHPEFAVLGGQIFAVFVMCVTVLACLPPGKGKGNRDLEIAMVIAAALLLPYNIWYHMQVILVPAFLVAWKELVERGWRLCLLCLFTLYALTSLHGLVWHALIKYPAWANIPLVYAIFLWLLLVVLTRTRKTPKPAAESVASETVTVDTV